VPVTAPIAAAPVIAARIPAAGLCTAAIAGIAARLGSVKRRPTAIRTTVEPGATIERAAARLLRGLSLRAVATIVAEVGTKTRSATLAIRASTAIIPP
jgi:hypothetical protein